MHSQSPLNSYFHCPLSSPPLDSSIRSSSFLEFPTHYPTHISMHEYKRLCQLLKGRHKRSLHDSKKKKKRKRKNNFNLNTISLLKFSFGHLTTGLFPQVPSSIFAASSSSFLLPPFSVYLLGKNTTDFPHYGTGST